MIFSAVDPATVALEAVDERDERLRITTRRDIDPLVECIGHLGLINAPVLRKTTEGYSVVCGFRRIEACHRLGMETIPARLTPGNISELACVEMAVADNAMQRTLNQLELSRCFRLLSPFYPRINMLTEAGKGLGLPDGAAYVRKLLSLAELPENIQRAVGRGDISLSMVEALQQSDPVDAAAMAALFGRLKPSLNKQREIFQLCREISKREDIPISTLLDSPPFKMITTEEEVDANRRTTLLREALRKRRMPALSKADEEFQRELAQLALGKGITLVPPPGFEGRTYRLTIEFSNRQNLEDRLAGLKTLVTGAASGIGKAIALRYAREGADVCCVDLNRDGAETTANEIRDLGRDAFVLSGDVSDSVTVQQFVKDYYAHFHNWD